MFCRDIHTAEDTGDEAEKNPDFQAEIFHTLFLYASCHDWTISDHLRGNPSSVIKSRGVSSHVAKTTLQRIGSKQGTVGNVAMEKSDL